MNVRVASNGSDCNLDREEIYASKTLQLKNKKEKNGMVSVLGETEISEGRTSGMSSRSFTGYPESKET